MRVDSAGAGVWMAYSELRRLFHKLVIVIFGGSRVRADLAVHKDTYWWWLFALHNSRTDANAVYESRQEAGQ